MNILLHDRYRLEAILGIGGQAVVYKAFDEQLKVDRAIKVLSPQLLYEGRARQRFEAEARIMAGLDHPNVAQVYDIVSTSRYLFIVMELLGNQSLWDWVKVNGPLPEGSIITLMDPILDLISNAHEQGIVHRDIKPSNILIGSSGQTKLTDFGIAHIQPKDDGTQFTKTGTVMGTWGYMSPEQRHNSKTVDARSDIYAVGATIFALISGRRPVDLFASNQDSSLLEGLSPTMMVIIQKCTCYNANERYENIHVLRAALKATQKHFKPLPDDFQYPNGKNPNALPETQNHPDILSLFSILSQQEAQPFSDERTFILDDGHTAVVPHDIDAAFNSRRTEPTEIETSNQNTKHNQSEHSTSKTNQSVQGSSITTEESSKVQLQAPSKRIPIAVSLLMLLLVLGSLYEGWRPVTVTENTKLSQVETLHTCQLIAQTLIDQQHADGGFSGIPQLPSSLWDTAQQISALTYGQKCGISIETAQQSAVQAMLNWLDEDTLKWQHAYGAGWFYLSTANLENPILTAKSKELVERFRLENGAYAVTLKDKEENKADPYATTMAVWGMYMHMIEKSHLPYQDTILRLSNMLESGQLRDYSGLEEQAWWTLWIIGKRHPEYAPSEGLNQLIAAHMIQRCKWNENHDKCQMTTWPSGKIEFIQIDGKSNALVTQGLPWASIAADALVGAPGLSDETRRDIALIAKWTHHRLFNAPETLVQSPGYILSESLIAIAHHHTN